MITGKIKRITTKSREGTRSFSLAKAQPFLTEYQPALPYSPPFLIFRNQTSTLITPAPSFPSSHKLPSLHSPPHINSRPFIPLLTYTLLKYSTPLVLSLPSP
ncbi:unnamed protein product [Cuscuta europaea]|uniref:Uncharacterized protein n=1 Tax=Cuscuta europaea TaxID=41803 RepID=A0A9P1EMB8_CUSEU|nr:unnamed protein product [Cuscuta europaea]